MADHGLAGEHARIGRGLAAVLVTVAACSVAGYWVMLAPMLPAPSESMHRSLVLPLEKEGELILSAALAPDVAAAAQAAMELHLHGRLRVATSPDRCPAAGPLAVVVVRAEDACAACSRGCCLAGPTVFAGSDALELGECLAHRFGPRHPPQGWASPLTLTARLVVADRAFPLSAFDFERIEHRYMHSLLAPLRGILPHVNMASDVKKKRKERKRRRTEGKKGRKKERKR